MPRVPPRGSIAAMWLAAPRDAGFVQAAFGVLGHVRHMLAMVSRHTGIPLVVVAGIALVLSWRIARKLGRLCLEVSVAVVVLLALTRLGLVTW